MAVVCGRCSKLGSHRKSTNLEGGSGVNRLATTEANTKRPADAAPSKMDMKVDNGKVTAFRTRVALSFKYETE